MSKMKNAAVIRLRFCCIARLMEVNPLHIGKGFRPGT